jgi:hypothetical protein
MMRPPVVCGVVAAIEALLIEDHGFLQRNPQWRNHGTANPTTSPKII